MKGTRIVYRCFGLKAMRLLQGIASGLLGPRAFSGGLATALLDLLCHFLVGFGGCCCLPWASRSLGFLPFAGVTRADCGSQSSTSYSPCERNRHSRRIAPRKLS